MRVTLCIPLRAGTLISASLDSVLSILASCFSVFLIIKAESELTEQNSIETAFDNSVPAACLKEIVNVSRLNTPVGNTVLHVILYFNLMYWIQKVGLGFLLLYGVIKKRETAIRLWLFYTLMLLILSVLCFLSTILLQLLHWKAIPIYVVAFVIREYSFWIVSSYLNQLLDSDSKSLPITTYVPFSHGRVMEMESITSVDLTLGAESFPKENLV